MLSRHSAFPPALSLLPQKCRVQDVTSWVGYGGGREWGSPWISPLPVLVTITVSVPASIPVSVPVSIPAPHCDVSASRAERCVVHHPVNCTANKTVSTACNYFPGRRMINSAQELWLSANSPEQLSGRLHASPPWAEDAPCQRKFERDLVKKKPRHWLMGAAVLLRGWALQRRVPSCTLDPTGCLGHRGPNMSLQEQSASHQT